MAVKKMTMFKFSLFIFAMLIAVTSIAQDDVKEIPVDVTVGIDKVEKLDFRPSPKVEVGREEILTYTLFTDEHIREIAFKGLKAGKTSVIIRNSSGQIKRRYRVNVTSNDLSRTVIKLREFFKNIEGVIVTIKGGNVVVEGYIVVPSDISKINRILAREEYKNDVINFVELSPLTQRIIAKRMQDEIQKNGIKDVTVRVVNKQYWLEGFITRDGDDETAIEIAKGFLPDKVENTALGVAVRDRVDIKSFISKNIKRPPQPLPKLVKIIAQFVELTKDYNKVFGFKWEPTLSGDGGSISFGRTNDNQVSTSSEGTLTGTIANLFPKLASAKSAGNARVIQQGMVVVKERTRATIQKTTKIPYAIGTDEFLRAQQASAGFTLNITPAILPEQNVDMQTQLTVGVATGSPPVETSNSINTALVVKSSESAVLGGVSLSETNTAYDRDPPFGVTTTEDPSQGSPLFSFLRSKAYVSNKSQYVVFITPQIIESASRGTEEIKRKFRRRRK